MNVESSSIPDYSRLTQAIQLLGSSVWQGCHALYSTARFLSPSQLFHPLFLALTASYYVILSQIIILLFFTSLSHSLSLWASSCCSSYSVPEGCAEHQVTRFSPLSLCSCTPPLPPFPHSLLCTTQSTLFLHCITKGLWGAVWLCRALASHLLNHQSAASVGCSV